MVDPAAESPDRGYKNLLGLDDVFLVYTPLADWTVESLIRFEMITDSETREKILWQLLDGIAYLHEMEVMHRDIKPLNMMVVSLNTPRPQARLIDFGLAENGLESSKRVGTYPYMAPEMWIGWPERLEHVYTESVDIFAFGLSMYQFCCQELCVWDRIDTDAEGNPSTYMHAKIRRRLLQSKNHVGLKSLIDLCITWDPDLRPSAKGLIRTRDEYRSVNEYDQSSQIGDGQHLKGIGGNWDGITTSMGRLGISEHGGSRLE